MNSYELSRKWFDFCFENPEKIKPNHTALYFFIVEHCNRLGWKEKFGLPTTMAKEAIGIRSYNTYINTLNDLVSFGFVSMLEKSKNQYSSNIVALSNFNKAKGKALDKALINHGSKQDESIDSIDKQGTTNKEKLLANTVFREDVCKQLQISVDEYCKHVQVFCISNDLKRPTAEIKRHVFNWLKTQELKRLERTVSVEEVFGAGNRGTKKQEEV